MVLRVQELGLGPGFHARAHAPTHPHTHTHTHTPTRIHTRTHTHSNAAAVEGFAFQAAVPKHAKLQVRIRN